MVSPSSSQLATAFSGPPGLPPPIAASESRSIGMYAPYEVMPTIEPSGWSGASVRLGPGDCKRDDTRRPALLSGGKWGPASPLARFVLAM